MPYVVKKLMKNPQTYHQTDTTRLDYALPATANSFSERI